MDNIILLQKNNFLDNEVCDVGNTLCGNVHNCVDTLYYDMDTNHVLNKNTLLCILVYDEDKNTFWNNYIF